MSVGTVGVLGAGTIGRGVAQALAEASIDVHLVDVSKSQLDDALVEIGRDLRMFGMFRAQPLRADVAEILARIHPTTDLSPLEEVDFVVENVTENWDVKRAVYEQIDVVCRPDVIFGVNTSAIPITRVASRTSRPEQVIGMHFMNPVPLMQMVEVIRGRFTSDATLQRANDLLGQLGKVGVVVQDSPGFVTNRVLMLTINEAIFCIQDGVATAEQIDDIFRGCFGHKMGPLATADLIGLDTVLNSITGMYESFKDSKYRPSPVLQQMVDAGLLGRKAGRGFYTYERREPHQT